MKSAQDLYYVGIGASAGGLEAIESFFKYMPGDAGLVFIVIQHLSPDFKSLMNELLARYTDMDILVAEDGMETHPNTVYLIPPKNNLSIFHGKLLLEEQNSRHHLNLPIDIFFRSLALDQGKNAIGVILSGTGSDGTQGIKALKEAGGMVMVQDEGSAKFDGMPRSSIATGLVDYILPPHKMPEEILNFIHHPALARSSAATKEAQTLDSLDDLTRISMIMRNHGGIDFTSYKENTLTRRIERRIKVNRISELADYIELLQKSEIERDTLQREFLIGVTGFFRDRDAFEGIRSKVIPNLDYSKNSIRIWSAGCSTGEEVYSLAILFREFLDGQDSNTEIKIFATDVDQSALDFASAGFYAESTIADIEPELIGKYFQKREDGYRIHESIRKMVVFAKHNILKDPPFSKLDLLVCRNLFIYLKSDEQLSILTSFYHSLNPGGYLFLGSSESLGEIASGFRVVDSKWKIYQYKEGYRPPVVSSIIYPSVRADRKFTVEPELGSSAPGMRIERVLMQVLSTVSPPSILIDSSDNIVQVINDVSPYIQIQPGRFSNSIAANMSKEQALFINNILRRLKTERSLVKLHGVSRIGKDRQNITIEGRLIALNTANFYLISFIEQAETAPDGDRVSVNMTDEVKERIHLLENELQLAREGLQATIEELETSNEELQSSNEELIASNEELQSTNEELQSVNEELFTVNNEYQHKIEELVKLNNDLNNLIKNTEVGAIYLDARLRIRKITHAIPVITNVMESDLGRPISHITIVEAYPTLTEDIVQVLDSLQPLDVEMQLANGRYYEARIRPYRTEYNAAEGVLVTFVDITRLKNEQQQVLQSKNMLDAALELGKMAWWQCHLENGIMQYADNMAALLGYKPEHFPCDLDGMYQLIHPQDRDPVAQAIAACIDARTDHLDIVYRIRRSDKSFAWLRNRGQIAEYDDDDQPATLIGTVIDISDYRHLQNQIRQSAD